MNKKTKKEKKLICRFGCGAYFDNTPVGKAQLMNHYQWDCPKNPNRITRTTKRLESSQQEMVHSEPILDRSEILERIIREVSQSKKIPAIMRMVEPYIDDPKKGLERLAEALRLADFREADMKLILWNWAQTLGISSEKVLKDDQEEMQKDEKKLEGKTLDSSLAEEMKSLQLARIKKERMLLERELERPVENEKQVFVIDGISMRLMPAEILAWKRYLAEKHGSEWGPVLRDQLERQARELAIHERDLKQLKDDMKVIKDQLDTGVKRHHFWSRK